MIITIIFVLSFTVYLVFLKKKYRFVNVSKSKGQQEKTVLEDILKCLYGIREEGNSSSVEAVVKTLNFSEAKVVEVLTKMEEVGLIQVLQNDIRLTADGEEYALRIIKAHRLWERYLAEKTGYDKRDWHRLAEKAEHTLTEEDVVRLTKELKKPLFDPHGSPIPYDKSMPEIDGKSLMSCTAGFIGRIVHINDQPEIFYAKIMDEQIHIGSQVNVLEKTDRYVEFEADGKQHKLEALVAAGLTVEPLNNDEVFRAKICRLSDLKREERSVILGISKECRGERRRRLLDLGFVKGTRIQIANISPMGDPVAYSLHDTLIALRNEYAQFILIEKEERDV